jgi:hypothetical protein
MGVYPQKGFDAPPSSLTLSRSAPWLTGSTKQHSQVCWGGGAGAYHVLLG